MTEDEAKTKWCCAEFAKSHDYKCAGSACMAWRWDKSNITSHCHTKDKMEVREDGVVHFTPSPPNEPGWRIFYTYDGDPPNRKLKPPERPGISAWRMEHAPTEGFCGLAGKP